jgi:hypothetical protein
MPRNLNGSVLMTETIEQSAVVIWSMARDLASPRASGTPLNAERNVRYIASVLNAYAAAHAHTSILAAEVLKTYSATEKVKHLTAEVKQLKSQLDAKKKKGVCDQTDSERNRDHAGVVTDER